MKAKKKSPTKLVAIPKSEEVSNNIIYLIFQFLCPSLSVEAYKLVVSAFAKFYHLGSISQMITKSEEYCLPDVQILHSTRIPEKKDILSIVNQCKGNGN